MSIIRRSVGPGISRVASTSVGETVAPSTALRPRQCSAISRRSVGVARSPGAMPEVLPCARRTKHRWHERPFVWPRDLQFHVTDPGGQQPGPGPLRLVPRASLRSWHPADRLGGLAFDQLLGAPSAPRRTLAPRPADAEGPL